MQNSAAPSHFDAHAYADAYPVGVEDNFWNIARNEVIERELKRAADEGLVSAKDPILEIGCGCGIVVKYLRDRQWNVVGSELGTPTPRSGLEDVVWTGRPAGELPLAFRQTVKCILLLDVIEHIEDHTAFLREIVKDFPECKCFLITVPARREVWSNFDEYYGHHRRYDRPALAKALSTGGLDLLRQGYFFQSLYLVALMTRLLRITRNVKIIPPKSTGIQWLISRVFWLERRLTPRALAGLSLIALARPQTRISAELP